MYKMNDRKRKLSKAILDMKKRFNIMASTSKEDQSFTTFAEGNIGLGKTSFLNHFINHKFMKKTKDKVEKEQEKKETEDLFSSQITNEMKFGKHFIIEPSIARCKELINGRLSFNGMNPEIEREMATDRGDSTNTPDVKSTDVSDIEMAKYQMSLENTVAKKFQKKSERNNKANVRPNKKSKFLKPNDDD